MDAISEDGSSVHQQRIRAIFSSLHGRGLKGQAIALVPESRPAADTTDYSRFIIRVSNALHQPDNLRERKWIRDISRPFYDGRNPPVRQVQVFTGYSLRVAQWLHDSDPVVIPPGKSFVRASLPTSRSSRDLTLNADGTLGRPKPSERARHPEAFPGSKGKQRETLPDETLNSAELSCAPQVNEFNEKAWAFNDEASKPGPPKSTSDSSSEDGIIATHVTPPRSHRKVKANDEMAKARIGEHAEERAEVEVLYAQAQKHADIGKRLAALQARLQGGGRSVQESIGPIHDNTKEHQTVSSNADALMAFSEKMLEAGQDKKKEELVIQASISRVNLSEYLASMRRLQRSRDKASSSSVRVEQEAIGDTNKLLNEGSNKLQEYFRSLLSERGQPVEPLNFITKQLPFPALSEDRISQLSAIEKVFASQSNNPRDSPAVLIYSDLRAAYLATSLQSMALATISTSKRQNPEEIYRQGTSAIGTYLSSMEGLFTAEFRNIKAIFVPESYGAVFDLTCRRPMAEFAKTLRELSTHIKTNMTTDCFLAFEVLEIAGKVSSNIGREIGDLKLPFSETLKPIREVAKASLSELLDDQRRRISALPALPLDGGASPFTNETMLRLQSLTAYPRSFSSLLASLGDGNWGSSSTAQSAASATSVPSLRTLDVGADGTPLQIHYVLDTIDTHMASLESRGKALHRSKAVLGVFLANSIATVDRMIRSSELGSLLSSNPVAQNKLEVWRKKSVSTYLDAWREPCAALFDVQYTNRPSSNRPASGTTIPSIEIVKALSSKDKDAIKEKFKHFNTSFDECIRKHKEMMPGMEREVKSNLGREVGNMVEPLYSRFWDRYEAIDRNRGKYVRWDKGQLASALAGLE